MDVFRVGEALLRSSQPMLPFLAPSAYRAPHATRAAAPIARHCRNPRPTTRSFATSQCLRQQGAAAAPAPEADYDDFPSTSPSSRNTIDDKLSSFLDDSLDFKKDSPASSSSRTSHFSSPNAQATNPPSRSTIPSPSPNKSSLDDLMDMIKKPDSHTPSFQPHKDASSAFHDINALGLPKAGPVPDEDIPLKLGPTLGRTIKVNESRGVDVGRAFRMLEMECARNSVRRDFMRQRFHERPGLKRKRLKSERWRKNFKKNFQGIVAMVQKMRKQGW